MRVLFLTPQLPYPPRQGTALRNWGLISGLAERHEVWLLSFDEVGAEQSGRSSTSAGDQADRFAPPLRDACARIAAFPVPHRTTGLRLRTLLSSRLPDMAWRLWSPDFAAQFDDWVSHTPFDVVQIEGIEMARYALESRIPNLQTPIVFDDHNCEYLLQRRAYEADRLRPARWHAAAYSSVQWRRLRTFEQRIVRAARATLCVSAQDAAAIQGIEPSARPRVIVNGIDVGAYSAYRQQTTDDGRRGTATLVFTGKMDFRWNVDAMLWFGREVMPLVRQQVPGVRLLIVGQQPSPRLDALRSDPAITITGAVDDTRPYIARSDVYVAPLRVGSGTRFKLLEAMSMRRAIVSTTLGCEGFEVRDGQELLIADQPADFAAAVVRLLRDPQLRATMGERGLAFAAAQYDWSVIVPRLERIYGEILA